jgi:putative spermidine/putrescine transport system substrate-binding protein
MMKSGKWLILSLALALALAFNVGSGVLAKRSKPVKLTIVDVAGNLQLTQPAIEAFRKANPNLVSEIEFLKSTPSEITAKIKTQQASGYPEIALVLTGTDAMASGVELKIWERLMPNFKKYFSNLESNYLAGAKAAYRLFAGYGLPVTYCPGGPMFTYNPDKVKNVPTTPEKLLEWAKANPGKFLYARPASSGPGRSFLQGLPYILGDKNPKNPKTWTKTWKYLEKLNKYIDYYPTSTGITFKELNDGTRYIIASHLGWDINQRILGAIPANFQGFFFKKTTWVVDTHFMCMPKGLDKNHKKAILALMSYLLKPHAQAVTYDSGYFYPGPAIKNIPLSMAPKASRDKVSAAARPAYEKAIKNYPAQNPLDAKQMVEAFEMWDKLVGSKTMK